MTAKIYIDVYPDGTFGSGAFWGDVQQYAATNQKGVTSYFSLAIGADGENVKEMLEQWRHSFKIESAQDWRLWAAACMLRFPGTFFERVSAEERLKRIAPPNEELKKRIARLLLWGPQTTGVIRNRMRNFKDEQIFACLDEMKASNTIVTRFTRNPVNNRTSESYHLTDTAFDKEKDLQ